MTPRDGSKDVVTQFLMLQHYTMRKFEFGLQNGVFSTWYGCIAKASKSDAVVMGAYTPPRTKM